MHPALILAVSAALSVATAQAADLVAARPGLMCHSKAALSRLTLPDGDSRTHLPDPAPADERLADTGGCYDLDGSAQRVTVIKAFHNTSIVSTAVAGAGPSDATTFVVPNVDFEPADAPGSAPGPAAPHPGPTPPGYAVAERMPVGGAASDDLVLLLDRRLTPDLRHAMWEQTSVVGDVMDAHDPRQAEFKARPVLNAQLRLMSRDGTVLDTLRTGYPLAEVKPAPIHGLPAPLFEFTDDESAGFGGFSGPATLLLTPSTTALRPVAFVSDSDGTRETLVLASTLHAGWTIVPSRQGGPDEIEAAYCPGGGTSHLFLLTYRFRDGAWHEARRTGEACGDLEAMPPPDDFP